MKNNTVPTIVLLVVTGLALISIGLIVGVLLLRQPANQPLISQPTATVLSETSPAATLPPESQATPTARASSQPTTQIPADVAAQMDEIQQQVTSIRGLSLKSSFNRDLLTTDQLKQNVINDFFKDYTPEDAARDSKILSAFGLLQPGFDLQKFYIDLYSEQVAGYYDNQTKSMYVISDEAFGGTERMTYAHEFTHTLQDQNYDIENGLKVNTDACKVDTEYCAAVTALMEGDATLSEQFWLLRYSTNLDKQQIQQFQQTYTSPVYDSAPAYMKQDFLFPYMQGFEFVNALYGKDGWQSVDQAYANPPVSTEQILHPAKYPNDKPIPVEVPDFTSVLGSDWKEIDRNVMGEWYISLILDAGNLPAIRLDETTAQKAAAGWGGDTYVFYTDSASSSFTMVWQSLWETSKDTDEFWAASLDYGSKRWGTAQTSTDANTTWQTNDSGWVTMRRAGNQVLWMMTPSSSIQSELLTRLGTFGS